MKDMKGYVFLHAIGYNNFEKFIEKTLANKSGKNFNGFYIPETVDPSQALPILAPQWPSHRFSTLVAFEGNSLAFEGGFARNAVSSLYFSDAQEENMPEKLRFIQVSYLQKNSESSRAIFSALRFIAKIDKNTAIEKSKYSDTVFVDGKRAITLLRNVGDDAKPHNEAHIRGPLNKIKYVVIKNNILQSYPDKERLNQIGSAYSLQQMISNKRNNIVTFPHKPENVKLLNNFIDIEILRGTLALQKIALLQKMLKYHELNPTIDTNLEMQLSFSHKEKKTEYALFNSLITKDDLFLREHEEIPENQAIWINSQKTKIQKEINDIYLEIEDLSKDFQASEDSPIKTLKSTAETIQAIIYSSTNQDDLESYYEQQQHSIKNWEESAKIDLQLRFLIKKKVLLDLQKEVPLRVFCIPFKNNSQLTGFSFENFLTSSKIKHQTLFEYLATNKLPYAIINLGYIFLKNERSAGIFMTAFSAFDREFQKSILENAIQNRNFFFVKSILKHKSEDPAYFLSSAILNNKSELLKIQLESSAKKSKSTAGLIKYFSNELIIPFDTPIHLATELENDRAINEILQIIPNLTADPKNSKQETPLHIASRNGSLSTAKILIDRGARVLGSSLQNPIFATHLACMHGHTNILKILKDCTLNCEGPNAETPAFMAIKNGFPATAKFIIKSISPDSLSKKSSKDLTLQEISAKNSDYASLNLLIDYGVSNKKLTDNQFTSLHYAAFNGDAKSMRLMLERASKTDLEALSNGKTPLVVAILNNRYEVTKILLDKSPFNIDKPFDFKSKEINFEGMVTPLQAAILNRNLRITKLLLFSEKFDVKKEVELIEFKDGIKVSEVTLSLLDLAICLNSFEIFNLLLKSGAEVSREIQRGKYIGFNSLHLACLSTPCNLSIVKTLVQSEKLDIEAKRGGVQSVASDPSGITALQIAIMLGNFEVTKFLLSKGADISGITSHPELIISEKNARLMEFLSEKNLVKIVSRNIAAIASEEIRDKFIFNAITNNCTNLVRQLLDNDCYDIDKIIHIATINKNPEIFNLFLEKLGEDVDINTFGMIRECSLLHNAIRHKNSEVVKILLQRKEINPNQIFQGKTALEVALKISNYSNLNNAHEYTKYATILKALLDANADIEGITEKNARELLLFISVENGNHEATRSLLNKQVSVNSFFRGLNLLHVAIINKNNDIAKLLLEQDNLDLNQSVKNVFDKNHTLNALGLAIKEDNLEILQIMLSKNKDLIDKFKINGFTLLEFAIRENKFDAFKLLIENGANYNYKLDLNQSKNDNNVEFTALGFALYSKRTEMVKFLIENGAQIDEVVYMNKQTNYSLNAIQYIAITDSDDCKMLRLLLDAGARTDVVTTGENSTKGYNLLQLALAINHNNAIIDVLIDQIGIDGENLKGGVNQGLSTFQLAVVKKNIKAVSKLLLKGARIDETALEGRYNGLKTLDLSFCFGGDELTKYLLLHEQIKDKIDIKKIKTLAYKNLFIMGYMESIDILFKQFDKTTTSLLIDDPIEKKILSEKFAGLTLLQSAIIQDKEEVVSFLLLNNATVNKKIILGEYEGNNSIHLCIKKSENNAIFQMLLPQSDLAEYDLSGLAPIHLMVKNLKYKFMEIYLNTEGADPNISSMNQFKFTALHLAINSGDTKMTELLLTKADVNAIDGNGLSPLHLAVINEDYNILKILISHPEIRINETIKDGEYKGFTALHVAIKNEDSGLIKILLTHDQLDIGKPIEDGEFKGYTPLELAIYLNKELSLKTLLDCKTKRIDVEKITDSGENKDYTPLYWAIKNKKLSVTRQLVKAGANVNKVIEADGASLGLTYVQHGLLWCKHRELVEFLFKHADKDDFYKPIEKGLYQSFSTISFLVDEKFKDRVHNQGHHLNLLEKLLDKTRMHKRIKIEEDILSKGGYDWQAGSLSGAGAGALAGAGSWTEVGAGSQIKLKIGFGNEAGLKINSFSQGEGGFEAKSIVGEGGVISSIPSILVSSKDQFSKQSLQQKYTNKMEEVNSDFKQKYGEEYFEFYKGLLQTEYKNFTDEAKSQINKYLLEANEDGIEAYKSRADEYISHGEAHNDFKLKYLGLLSKKHAEFIKNEYTTYQAHKNQDQAPNSVIRQQLSVSRNSTQIIAQTASIPAQNLTQFVPSNPSSQIRQRDPDNVSERDLKRARS